MNAPESTWSFAWLKSAGLYLTAVTAYLATVAGLVKAFKKVFGESVHADAAIYALAGVAALPLLLGFFYNLLPALRRRRGRSLRPIKVDAKQINLTYFQTSPRYDDPHKFFEHGYEAYLEWARHPKVHSPILNTRPRLIYSALGLGRVVCILSQNSLNQLIRTLNVE